MKEAPFHIEDHLLLFRETFNDEQSVRRNGGIPTDVTFSNGAGTFNGTSSKIQINKPFKGTVSIRIRFKSVTPSAADYIYDFRTNGGSGYLYFNTSTNITGSGGTAYVNGVASNTVSTSTKEIVIVGTTINNNSGYIGCINTGVSNFVIADYDFIEIYNYALTAKEISNLAEGKRFTGITSSREQLDINKLANTGTPETTDWVDTNLDGAADGFVVYGTGSIITGNGFSGKAQRVDNINGSGDRLQSVFTVVSGRRYNLRFKYRCNANIVLQQGIAGLPNSLINIGDPIVYDESFIAGSSAALWFRINVIGNWFEIDELSLKEVLEDSVTEIMNVSAQSGMITNKYEDITQTGVIIVKEGELRGMLFDAALAKINCGSSYDLTGDISLVVWTKIFGYGSVAGRIVENGRFQLYVTTSGTWRFRSNAATALDTPAGTAPFNIWMMLGVQRDITGWCSIFINGKLVVGPATSGLPIAGITPITVGNSDAQNRGLDGQIRNFRLYRGLLSAKKFSQMYTNEKEYYHG